MELTPIKARGKRRPKGQQLPVAPSPKRPKRRPGHGERAGTRRPKASHIEMSMPLEVLERIFWLSENVNFPRAGPRLGRLLSGPSTLRETFLAAFGPTWDVWFGCVDDRGTAYPTVQSYVGWDRDRDRFGGNPNFQADLLACSWTTIDMILDCWDIWVRRHARSLSYQYFPLWGSSTSAGSYTNPVATVGSGGIKESRSYFYHDYDAFRNPERQDTSTCRLEHNHATWIEVHRSTEIPDRLINGPWDEGSLQKLFWLVRAGARLSPSQTWEATRQGFHNATSNEDAPNTTIIRLLHILGAFREWPMHVREEELCRIEIVTATLTRDGSADLLAKYYYIGMLLINDV
ncbi:putative actin cortical patch protein [Rosellinia necatrix]|uniref:Putative actin cortical patch protein n=1 Tax=Rosellinia necatrix TaxID=77044 RepID=A0A1W2TWF1_ROSNE|nr:putative actin cortical patch protein [Rosellinia necatrix]